MLTNINNDEIGIATQELINSYGVKDPPGQKTLDTKKVTNENYVEFIISKLLSHFELGAKIRIVWLSDYKENKCNFVSKNVVPLELNANGTGSHGIIAQILLPYSMPLYNTARFNELTLSIVISDELPRDDDMVISLIAHELSHVLMHSTMHPQKDSELYTDIIPIIFGLGKYVRNSKHKVKSRSQWDGAQWIKITTTTSLGYITREHIDNIEKLASVFRSSAKKSLNSLTQLLTRLGKLSYILNRKSRYFLCALEKLKTSNSIKKRDGILLVDFYSTGFSEQYQNAANEISKFLESNVFISQKRPFHYSNTNINTVKSAISVTQKYIDLAQRNIDEIEHNISIANRNLSIATRIALAFNR